MTDCDANSLAGEQPVCPPATSSPGEWWRYSQAYISWPQVAAIRDPGFRPAIPALAARVTAAAKFALASFCVGGVLICLAAGVLAPELSMPEKIVSGLVVAALISGAIGSGTYLACPGEKAPTITHTRLEALDPRVRGRVATALLALDDIEGSRAHRESFLGAIDVAAARWQVVRDAVTADDLLSLYESPQAPTIEDDRVLTEAATTGDRLVADLGKDAEALVRAALAARELSAQLDDETARVAALTIQEQSQAQRDSHQQRLREALAVVSGAGGAAESAELSETVTTRVSAYSELPKCPLGGADHRP